MEVYWCSRMNSIRGGGVCVSLVGGGGGDM